MREEEGDERQQGDDEEGKQDEPEDRRDTAIVEVGYYQLPYALHPSEEGCSAPCSLPGGG